MIISDDGIQMLPKMDERGATIEVDNNRLGSTFKYHNNSGSECEKDDISQHLTEEKNLSTRLEYTSYHTTLQCETPGNEPVEEPLTSFREDLDENN